MCPVKGTKGSKETFGSRADTLIRSEEILTAKYAKRINCLVPFAVNSCIIQYY
jgi:hypothetical protein